MGIILQSPNPQMEDQVFSKPDPGVSDFVRASMASIGKISPVPSLRRTLTMHLLDRFDLEMLEPEKANSMFSEVGLHFKKPVSRDRAQFMFEEKIRENRINETIVLGKIHGGPGRVVLGFAASLVRSFADPINIGASLFPALSTARWFSLVRRSGGTIKAGVVTSVPVRALAARGAAEGLLGNALVEPFVLFQAHNEQSDYGYVDAYFNLFAGAVLGAGIQIPVGKLKARFDRVRANLANTPIETKHAMMQGTAVDIMRDMPVESAGRIAMTDPGLFPKNITGHSFGSDIDVKLTRLGEAIDRLDSLSGRKEAPKRKRSSLTFKAREELAKTKASLEGKGFDVSVIDELINENVDFKSIFIDLIPKLKKIQTDAAGRGFIPKTLSGDIDRAFQSAMEATRHLRAEAKELNKGFSRRTSTNLSPQEKLGNEVRSQLAVIKRSLDEVVARGKEVRRRGFVGPKKVADMNRKETIRELRKFMPDLEDDFDVSTKDLKAELMTRREDLRIDPKDRGEQIDPDIRKAQPTEDERLAEFSPDDIEGQGTIIEHAREWAKSRESITDAQRDRETLKSVGIDPDKLFTPEERLKITGQSDESLEEVLEDFDRIKEQFLLERKGIPKKDIEDVSKLDLEDFDLSEAEAELVSEFVQSSDKFNAIQKAIRIAQACLKRNL